MQSKEGVEMFCRLKQTLNRLLYYVIPRIYNLPQCVYICWIGNEYIIPKQNSKN